VRAISLGRLLATVSLIAATTVVITSTATTTTPTSAAIVNMPKARRGGRGAALQVVRMAH